MRNSDLSHHRAYRSVHGGSINLTSNTPFSVVVLGILTQAGKHGAIPHVMPVNDCVVVGKIRCVFVVNERAAVFICRAVIQVL